ncbi:MAG TPA: POTRA domain-containing protein [Terriglobales bacterium]|nr:POTRA domain-containing protein [Terriglobales bacterium]
MKWLAHLTACACLLSASPARAQHHSPSAKPDASGYYKLLAVKAAGSARYTDQDILAASGLQIGQPAAEGDFKQAAQHLLNSGVFTDVAYTFSYSDAGIKVEFQLTDVDRTRLIPAHFENFIGLTDAELSAGLRQRVPLFIGKLPLSGQLTDQVNHALQAMLEEQHLPGQVDFTRDGEREDSPPTSITFSVHELNADVHSVEFPGATAEETAFLGYAARRIIGTPYSSSLVAKVIRDDLLPMFLQRGYLKASFGAPETRILSSANTQIGPAQPAPETADQSRDEIEVEVVLPVTPGKPYSVAAVDWKGNSAIPPREALGLLHLVAGQPADVVALDRDVHMLINLYRARGYMTAKVIANPEINEAAGTVHYEITVAEGDLYTMGELEFLGVDTASKDRLTDAWKLREGQPYNPDYTRKFVEDAPQLLPKGLQYSTKLSEDVDAKAKAVDVTIRFKQD